MQDSRHAQTVTLCQSAFHLEYKHQFNEAYLRHGEAIQALQQLIDDAKFLDRERKRVARKQIKFHTARQSLIAPLRNGSLQPQPAIVILPTSLSANDSIDKPMPNGSNALSLDEFWLKKGLMNPTAAALPRYDHLRQGGMVQAYAPLLDRNVPPAKYHIYISQEAWQFGGHLYYLKAKSDTPDRQTMYVLQVSKKNRYQMAMASLHRSAEFVKPVVNVGITGIGHNSSIGSANGLVGRDLRVVTPLGETYEKMDRQLKFSWGPRRFTYGGRTFVWVSEPKDEISCQTLCEYARMWPKPGSKTGKMEHQTVGPPLIWGRGRTGLKKCMEISMAGDLDQYFKEYILAVQLTRLAVIMHGHDSR